MSSIETSYIFDTNIFDKILGNQTDINKFPENSKYFVTHIQKDQIEAIEKTEKQEKKAALLTIFNNIPQIKIPTESGVYGISKYGECKYTSEEDNLLEEFRRGQNRNIEDALIGETAIKNNLILVTNDKDFRNKTIELGGNAITFEEFMLR